MNQNQINKIKSLKGKISDTEIRKEIRKLGYKKTAANNWFNKIFKSDETVPFDLYAHNPPEENNKIFESKDPSIKTLNDLIRVCEIDTSVWECVRFTGNSYGDNFQVKGEFKRKVSTDIHTALEDLKNDMLKYSPVAGKRNYDFPSNGGLLIVNISDAHIGKLSNRESCSHNYDLKIAKELYMKAVLDLVNKAKKQGGVKKIWYICGNDYLTVDTPQHTTTKGTPQEVDTRFSKIFREGRKLLVDSIEILKEIAPVHIIVMPGNHDRSSMFHLGDALECWYRNDPNVSVDNDDKVRKYYSFGKMAFNITHGDTIKTERLIQTGLTEYGEEWGKAKRRFIIKGHFHHYSVQHVQGVEIWTFPSISGSDEFHQSHGYVGSTRQAIAMIFSEDNLDSVFYSQPIEDKDYQ